MLKINHRAHKLKMAHKKYVSKGNEEYFEMEDRKCQVSNP
jgi:hypothetical protein